MQIGDAGADLAVVHVGGEDLVDLALEVNVGGAGAGRGIVLAAADPDVAGQVVGPKRADLLVNVEVRDGGSADRADFLGLDLADPVLFVLVELQSLDLLDGAENYAAVGDRILVSGLGLVEVADVLRHLDEIDLGVRGVGFGKTRIGFDGADLQPVGKDLQVAGRSLDRVDVLGSDGDSAGQSFAHVDGKLLQYGRAAVDVDGVRLGEAFDAFSGREGDCGGFAALYRHVAGEGVVRLVYLKRRSFVAGIFANKVADLFLKRAEGRNREKTDGQKGRRGSQNMLFFLHML